MRKHLSNWDFNSLRSYDRANMCLFWGGFIFFILFHRILITLFSFFISCHHFGTFSYRDEQTNRVTERPTDGWTDTPSYEAVRMHPKSEYNYRWIYIYTILRTTFVVATVIHKIFLISDLFSSIVQTIPKSWLPYKIRETIRQRIHLRYKDRSYP